MITAGLPGAGVLRHPRRVRHPRGPVAAARLPAARVLAGGEPVRGRPEAQGQLDRVFGISFSEFGRRVAENQNAGTDHGAASVMFAFGAR
ncbi:MAG: DUF1501 domain-containing protein [Gemmataceae bacterium]